MQAENSARAVKYAFSEVIFCDTIIGQIEQNFKSIIMGLKIMISSPPFYLLALSLSFFPPPLAAQRGEETPLIN